MKCYATTVLSALAIAISSSVAAAAFDKSEPFICASLEVHACEVGRRCSNETVESIDAPQFLRVSLEEKRVTGVRPSGAQVDTKIDLVNHAPNITFLQGNAGALVWSIAIDETSGRMSGTVSDDEDVYIIFGACTTLEAKEVPK